MEFIKYQHLEKYGVSEVYGIENGMCYIFPKIDGTNSQLWLNNGLQAGSRNRHLDLENDNAGFYAWALSQTNILEFFAKYPNYRLFGEWLIPHTLRTYQKTAWNKFYVFDVISEEGYLEYETYKNILNEFNIDFIPPLCKIKNPSYERLLELLDNNTYLIEDGKGTGEGIIIKNYNYRNKYGRIIWAKIVKNEFKAKHNKNETKELKEKKLVEEEIVNKYVTLTLIDKEFAKIENEDGWTSKQIPRLLQTIYYCLVKEECWNFVKEFKNPTIDFKRLFLFTTNKIKELKPNLF
jgi:hypothetical protein